MSHIPQRKEKDCLNCGAIVQGKYCQDCGQENIVPKETFWHMVTHFFYDITHFDTNFFVTVKDLLFKPGFLSKEYMLGRRASYLHPVKMYVFTSAIFFLLFFGFFFNTKSISSSDQKLTPKERTEFISLGNKRLAEDTGSIDVKYKLAMLKDTSRIVYLKEVQSFRRGGLNINFGSEYKSYAQYDSAEKALPPSERDGWLKRRLMKTAINIDQKFKENPEEASKKLVESIFHRLPYMLLISLPFFALILRLVYIRRKNFFYADHGIFTIHLYVFTFLMLLLMFLFDATTSLINPELPEWLMLLCILTMFFYLYKAMRNFYGQKRGKTFLKFLLVALLSLIMVAVLFVLISIFSAVTL